MVGVQGHLHVTGRDTRKAGREGRFFGTSGARASGRLFLRPFKTMDFGDWDDIQLMAERVELLLRIQKLMQEMKEFRDNQGMVILVEFDMLYALNFRLMEVIKELAKRRK